MMGKLSTMRKIKRQIRDLKYSFPDQKLLTIKEETVPLIMSKISNILIEDGSEGIEAVIDLLTEYKISNDIFKENIIELAAGSIVSRYEKLASSIKASLTRKLNERSKTSIKRTKNKNVVSEISNVRYDEEGNVREEKEVPEEEEESEDIKSIKTKAPKKKSTKKK